jgi:2,4-dienoyl-CoA reductase-like NADH-dependent reductase (Old Yellow Enzyme family)
VPAEQGLLFTPVGLGAAVAKNRVLMPAVVTNGAVANQGNEAVVRHYAARARGGAGAIVTEPFAVAASSLTLSGIIAGYDPRNRPFFAQLAEAVEREDCRLLGQIFHLGRHHITPAGRVSDAPTGRPDPVSWAVPHRMSKGEIDDVAEAFVAVAVTLRKAGFSGVELHGAQGFLIAQFLSPTNDRDDDYGGDLAGRLRFVELVADGIRAECGAQFIIALKMPADEGLGPGGLQLADAAEMVRRLADARRIDLFSFGSGGPGPTFDQHVPDMTFPTAPFADHLPVLKQAAGSIPIVGLGRITTATEAESLLGTGACDLVGLARPLLADAEWPNKVRRSEAPRPCIYCNSCWAQLPKQHALACVTNPLLGRSDELSRHTRQRSAPARLIVVGGGPAGLSAAAELARNGHEVTLLERKHVLGGAAAWQSRLPGRGEVARAVEHLAGEARAAGVDIRLGSEASAEDISAAAPQAVIVATGAGAGASPVKSGDLYVADLVAETERLLSVGTARGVAVLFDQSQTEATYAAAELLAQHYARLIILSPRQGFATESALVSLPGIHRRLAAAGVEVITGAQPVTFERGLLRWRSTWSGRVSDLEEVDAFIYATAGVANDNLVATLEGLGIPAVAIGDACAPRNLLTAVQDGFLVIELIEQRIASRRSPPAPPVAA